MTFGSRVANCFPPVTTIELTPDHQPQRLQALGWRRQVYVRGAALGDGPAVAVVGARAASRVAMDRAHALARHLAGRGIRIVSGGALGVDGASHRGALAGDGATTVVLGSGLDVLYPARHAPLFCEVLARGGTLAGLCPDGTQPHPSRFPQRNQLIAALADLVIVVEADLRSGSLSTAAEADKMGRPVLGVPGPITSAMSAGVHRALRRGALLVTSPAEVVEALGDLGVDLAPEPTGERRPRDDLDELTARVLDGVPARRPATLESIARTVGVTAGEAAAGLGLLELGGFVVRSPQGWRLAPGAPR